MSQTPIVYTPAIEHAEEGEAATISELIDTLATIGRTTYKDSGKPMRSVHAKSHGILVGQITVLPELPETLRQGLFASAGTYPVILRFSTTPGDMLDDKVSTPRGLAMKVLGVAGPVLESDRGSTQDFVLANAPAFAAPNLKGFLKNLKLLAKTTDKAEGLKKVLSATLRGLERAVEAVGGESGTLKSLGGHPLTNVLGETYYSQVPILFGTYMAKVAIAPCSPELSALKDAPVDLDGRPDGLRQAVVEFFAGHGADWELRVQLSTDLQAMPIEDASVVWPEDQSPYVAVARISVPAQNAWSPARVSFVNDRLAFNPWHGLQAHRPLGSIMRGRKRVYDQMSKMRAEQAATTLVEPGTSAEIPS